MTSSPYPVNIIIYLYTSQSMSKIPLVNPSLSPDPQPPSNGNQSQSIHKHKGISKKEKKKFKTRIKQFNPQSSSCLIESYDSECFAHFNNFSSRQKNNIAARTSRKRKKMYIQLLEEQNTNLQLQLYQINEQIQMQRSQIFNAIMHTQELNSKNGEIQSLVTKKLKSLTQMEPSHQIDTEINICLDSCIYRIGASGSERKAILDILYKGFINRNLPNNYRFLLWAAIHRFEIYGSDKNTGNWWEFIKSDLMSRFQHFFAEKGHLLQSKGKEILQCSRQILRIKKLIEQSGHLYDGFIKEIRQILTPSQSAELFLYADRATPKPELQLLQQQQILNSQEELRRASYSRLPKSKGVIGPQKEIIDLQKIERHLSFEP